MEGWKDGRMEGWKDGRWKMEGWKMEGCKSDLYTPSFNSLINPHRSRNLLRQLDQKGYPDQMGSVWL